MQLRQSATASCCLLAALLAATLAEAALNDQLMATSSAMGVSCATDDALCQRKLLQAGDDTVSASRMLLNDNNKNNNKDENKEENKDENNDKKVHNKVWKEPKKFGHGGGKGFEFAQKAFEKNLAAFNANKHKVKFDKVKQKPAKPEKPGKPPKGPKKP